LFLRAAILSVSIFIFTGATSTAKVSQSNYAKAKKIIYAVFPNSTEAGALKVAGCETGYTYSPHSTGSAGERGYFQIHPSNASRALYDPKTKKSAGKIQFNKLYQPWYNTWVAYYMSNNGNWGEWTCGWAARYAASYRVKVVKTLQRGLSRFPLGRHVSALESAGKKYNVNPYFMAAAAGVESTFGRQPCGENPRNIWGLGACNSVWSVPYFETWREAFNYYAHFLKRTWPRARTAYEFYGYSACDSCWGSKAAYYMRYFFNSGPQVAYPKIQ
jgi:hypothetical protein